MPAVSPKAAADQRQPRATPVRARGEASRQGIVQAAMALWRTKGFDDTTVTDICKAAGVSKALFYVYFSRKEDVLQDAELFAMREAHVTASSAMSASPSLEHAVAAVIETLASRMRQYPPDLVFEAVIESYRLERRAYADGGAEEATTFLFLEPFAQAQRDGLIGRKVDHVRAARIAQTIASDGIRRWVATGYADPAIAQSIAADIVSCLG